MTSAEVDTKGNTEVAEQERVSEQFAKWLQRVATANEATRANEVAMSQADRILNETDLDAIMDADEQGTYQLRDLVGIDLRIPPPGFPNCARKSAEKFEAPLGAYIQFPAFALSNFDSKGIVVGDELLISTGAPLVVAKLRTMEANGFLPFDFRVHGVEGQRGTVLKLRRIPASKKSSEK